MTECLTSVEIDRLVASPFMHEDRAHIATEQIVENVRETYSDWKMVAERVRADTSRSDPVRRAALNKVLRRATASNEEDVATPNEPEAKVTP